MQHEYCCPCKGGLIMIKFYKSNKKNYYERQIKEHIQCNLSKIEEHKNAPIDGVGYKQLPNLMTQHIFRNLNP